MNKVTSINLNGRAYQLEEEAYAKLHSYLVRAERKLASDPDKDEVMHDFEQAIAEKCDQLLSGHKNVVTEKEMTHIIKQMGPVEASDDEADESTSAAAQDTSRPRRLYALKEGAIFAGVCNGLAAYLNLDVTIVRLLFIVLTLTSGGAGILVYFVIMLVVPVAVTPEQKAELRGERFSAKDVLSKAKQKYADLGAEEHWKNVSAQTKPALSRAGAITLQITRLLAGIGAFVSAFTVALLTSALVCVSWWVLFGQIHLPDQLSSIPHWQLLLTTIVTYLIIALPMMAVTQILFYFSWGKKLTRHHFHILLGIALTWGIAVMIFVGLLGANGTRLGNYQETHGYVYFGPNNTRGVCINDNLCAGRPNNYDWQNWDPGRNQPLQQSLRSSTIMQ